MCDYATGFTPPEMVKRRPFVVITPRLRNCSGLCAVALLGATAPDSIALYHYELVLCAVLP